MDDLKQFNNTFKEIVTDIINTNKVYNNTKYQDSVSYQKRCEDSARLCIKYPDYVPVIVNCFNPELLIKPIILFIFFFNTIFASSFDIFLYNNI